MTKQREGPGITPQQLETFFNLPAGSVKVSGGQFENFREGWAKNIQPGGASSVVHYFCRNGFEDAVALCGARAPVRWLYGPGNYVRCSRCGPKAARRFGMRA